MDGPYVAEPNLAHLLTIPSLQYYLYNKHDLSFPDPQSLHDYNICIHQLQGINLFASPATTKKKKEKKLL